MPGRSLSARHRKGKGREGCQLHGKMTVPLLLRLRCCWWFSPCSTHTCSLFGTHRDRCRRTDGQTEPGAECCVLKAKSWSQAGLEESPRGCFKGISCLPGYEYCYFCFAGLGGFEEGLCPAFLRRNILISYPEVRLWFWIRRR